MNRDGKFVYIKYHFIAKHGQKQFTAEEVLKLSGEDPDYSKKELWEGIENGERPEWTAKVQIMEPEEADFEKLGFDPFDVTKVWPRDQFPVGTIHSVLRILANVSDARLWPPSPQQEPGELPP